jgi:Flp pilus assembly protein TadD
MELATNAETTLESHSFYNRALEMIQRNRYKVALDQLIKALRISPGNPIYLSYFGLCLAHVEHDYGRAIRVCRQAIMVLSRDPVLRVNLGKVYKLTGDKASAHKEFLRAWELNNEHPSTAAELARMGIRRPPFFTFLPRRHWVNRYLGVARAFLERKLVGHRQS